MLFKMPVRKFRMGIPEIALILIIVLLIFGAAKLPQIGKALGKGLRSFKKAQDGAFDDDKDDEVTKVESVETVAPKSNKATESVETKTAESTTEQKTDTTQLQD